MNRNRDGKESLLEDSLVARYVHAAIDLRNCVEINAQDEEFAFANYGEIRYLFDTNVVRFFFNPIKRKNLFSFSSDIDPSVMTALAIVTGEYLFSRELCGQWGTSALISPAHAQELERRAAELVETLSAGSSLDDSDDALTQKIDETIYQARYLSRLETSIEKLFESDHDIRRIISDEGYEARMFTRIVEEDLLKPLLLDPLVNNEVLRPPEEEISWWFEQISKKRRRLPNSRKSGFNRRPETSYNDRADAETLVQLISLNRLAKESGIPARYVLVSADQIVYNVMVSWYKNQRVNNDDCIDFFPIRRIGQYVPFLTRVELSNVVTSPELVADIRAAVDALLESFGGLVEKFPLSLPSLKTNVPTGEDTQIALSDTLVLAARLAQRWGKDTKIQKTINQLAALWTDLARDSVFLNANMLGRRIRAFSELADFLLRAEDVRSAVGNYMAQTVAGVEHAHVEFVIKHRLASIIKKLSDVNEEGAATRAMFMMRPRFGDFTGNFTLYEYLNHVVANPESEETQQLYTSITNSSNHQALLFAGCVAFWASGWESALFFAERALRRAGDRDSQGTATETDFAELDYFKAVATRYVAMDMDGTLEERVRTLQRVLNLIEEHESKIRDFNDSFFKQRAKIEKGLTLATMAYVKSLQGGEASEAAADTMRQAKACFKSGLLQHLNQENTQDTALKQQMGAEVCIGLAGSILHEFFFGESIPDSDLAETRELSEKVCQLSKDAPELIPKVYFLASDLLDIMSIKEPEEKEKMAKVACLKMMDAQQQPVATTRLDRLVMEELGNRLEKIAC